MADEKQLHILQNGVLAWNEWRTRFPDVLPDLSKARLLEATLRKYDLRRANLEEAVLRRANLFGANLTGANMRGAHIQGADLREANLENASLHNAIFSWSTLWPEGFDPLTRGAIREPGEHAWTPDLTIFFDASIPVGAAASMLGLLADYYRACGGIGFETEFELTADVTHA